MLYTIQIFIIIIALCCNPTPGAGQKNHSFDRAGENAPGFPSGGTEGLVFRFFWYSPRLPGPATILRFSFPVGTDYPTQKIDKIYPLYPGASLRNDEEGNTIMNYAAPIPIRNGQDLLLGFITRGRFGILSTQKVNRAAISWDAPVPIEIRETYLERKPFAYSLSDPLILSISSALVSDGPDPILVTHRVWNFVHEKLFYRKLPRPNTAADILSAGHGKCGEFTRLSVSLLRACGLPARGVYGFRLTNDGPTGDAHAWAETYLPGSGWVPIQPQKRVPNDDSYPYLTHYVMRRFANEFDDSWLATSTSSKHSRTSANKGRETLAYDINTENTSTAWSSGVGFFLPIPLAQSGPSANLACRIAADDGSRASKLLSEISKVDQAARPMLYFELIASRDAISGQSAAAALVNLVCQSKRTLSLDKFFEIAPTRVKDRIAMAAATDILDYCQKYPATDCLDHEYCPSVTDRTSPSLLPNTQKSP